MTCRSLRLPPSARSPSSSRWFLPIDWVRGQRLARGVPPPFRRRERYAISTGTEVSVWSSARRLQRWSVTAPVAPSSPASTPGFRPRKLSRLGSCHHSTAPNLRSRSLSRPYSYVAVTGAEDRGRFRPAPGGVDRDQPVAPPRAPRAALTLPRIVASSSSGST